MKLEELLKKTKEEIRGKIICFPTDTVYGVGCMIDDEAALQKIYHIKHRDLNKPLAVLFPSIDSVCEYGIILNNEVNELMKKHWPGALTLIMPKKRDISNYVTSGNQTIGCRIPQSDIAIKILEHFGPMATTSVNLSGKPALNDLQMIKNEFYMLIDYYIDEQCTSSKVSSTVVDVSKVPFVVLREGDVKII